MAGTFADRVLQASTTTGTGNFSLVGADLGYNEFFGIFGTTNMFHYCIEGVDGSGNQTDEWEVGRGHMSDATTLVRDVIQRNSDDTLTAVNFSVGDKNVFCTFSGMAARQSSVAFHLQYGMP